MLQTHYQILDTLHENQCTRVYRAKRLSDNVPVIIKILKPEARNEIRMSHFMNEQRTVSIMNSKKVVRLLDVFASASEYAHIFEDIGGYSLYELFHSHTFTLSEALKIALDVAHAMALVHKKRTVHLDINPKNIVYNPQTAQLQLIDFGASIMDTHLYFANEPMQGASGNIMYMSPEQIGRTKQKIDYRSDFYSFGMTLYHLFSGHAPFEAQDRFELIHKHMALHPKPISEIKANFPVVLGEIIAKLIAKDPSKRYQTDGALIFDLKQCLSLLDSSGAIKDFHIATHDQPIIEVGDILFGRDIQIQRFHHVLEEIKNKKPFCIMVSGQAGVGKTRLIEEFLMMSKQHHCIIVRAKCEQYRSAHPYQMLKQLLLQIKPLLMRHNVLKQLMGLQPRFIWAIGHVCEELQEVLPSYREMTGNVYLYLASALEALFSYIGTAQTPLVLSIDDLQWADQTTLELLSTLMIPLHNPYVHWSFSFRPLQNNKALEDFLLKVQSQSTVSIDRIELENLSFEMLHEMVLSLFHMQQHVSYQLATILFKKTEGNPFYLKTLIHTLIEKKWIYFKEAAWHVDLTSIQSMSAHLSNSAIIQSNFDRLLASELKALQVLALLGLRFTLKLATSLLADLKMNPSMIEALEQKNMLEIYGKEVIISHDLILHYAVESLELPLQATLHWRIGLFLERQFNAQTFDDIVAVVMHFNAGLLVGRTHPKLDKLNFQALQEMLFVNAYKEAWTHMKFMIEHDIEAILLKRPHAVRFAYEVLKVKILYLNARHEEALASLLGIQSKNRLEALQLFRLRKEICVTQGTGFEALESEGRILLASVGIPQPDSLQKELEKLFSTTGSHILCSTPKEITALPRLEKPKIIDTIDMLMDYWETAYYLADIEKMQWAFLHIMRLSFAHGNTAGSAFGYVLFGAHLVGEGKLKEGFALGRVALDVTHLFEDKSMVPKIYNFMANFIAPYTKGMAYNPPLYEASLAQSITNGDIVFGTWANFLLFLSRFFAGEKLDTLYESMQNNAQWLLGSGDQKMIAAYKMLLDCVSGCQEGTTQERGASAVALWEEENFYPALAWYGILQAQKALIEGDIQRGLDALTAYVHSQANEVIMFPKLRLHKIRALLLLSKEVRTPQEEAHLQEDLAQLSIKFKGAPKVFGFWKALLDAMQPSKAQTLWDQGALFDVALKIAHEQHNSFEIALGGLLAGRFWSAKHFHDVSRFYFNEAIVGLNQWGAYAYVASIKALPTFQARDLEDTLLAHSSSTTDPMQGANYRSLLNAFHTLSEATSKHELITKLMRNINEYATASRAVLILKESQGYVISANVTIGVSDIDYSRSALKTTDELPVNIVHHAINTHRKVVVHHPAQSGKFGYDPYFTKHQPQSSTALPLLVDSEVYGVLYLEQTALLAPLDGVTLDTLKLLLTQVGIVLKNTLLLETLQNEESRFNDAQEISQIGSYEYDPQTDVLMWSKQTYRLYEIEPFSQHMTLSWVLEHIHPEDMWTFATAQERLFTYDISGDVTVRIHTNKGNIKTVRFLAKAVWYGLEKKYTGTIQDLTESAAAQATIEKLSQVVEQTPFAIMLTDVDGFIEYVNSAVSHMTGYFPQELVGRSTRIFKSDTHSKDFYANLWETISIKRTVWRGTITNRMKNGTLREWASTIFPIINAQDVIIGYASIRDDVTERNFRDKLFLKQTRQAQMGEMLSMIAHQWRQPLSVINALLNIQRVNLELGNPTKEETHRAYDDIEVQVQHLSHTITDFRDFFKPNKEKTLTTMETLVKKVFKIIGSTYTAQNIAIHKNFIHDDAFWTYESELIQALLNIFKNALDAHVEHHTPHPYISITSDQTNDTATLIIEDNAGGIPNELLETIFDPYVSTKSKNGTGIGLYMTKIIIEDHCKGKIHAENTPEGAQFILQFPTDQN